MNKEDISDEEDEDLEKIFIALPDCSFDVTDSLPPDIIEQYELEVDAEEHIENKSDELPMNTDLQESFTTVKDAPKLQESGNDAYIFPLISNQISDNSLKNDNFNT